MPGTSVQEKLIPLVEPWFPPSYADAVRDQVLSGFIGPGRAAQTFADALGALTGTRCVLTVSGTVALSVAAQALGLKPGDEILVPAYGVISTINAFASMGLAPRLVDIDPVTACMSLEALVRAISPRTTAVCFVNFSGYTGENVMEIAAECSKRGLPLIEDAACALGHRYQGRAAGAFGTVGTYSFSVPKVLTTGQGGAVLSASVELYEKAAAFVDQGDLEWRKTNLNRGVGTNLRFTDIQASLAMCQMQDLETRLARRRASYQALKAGLGACLYSVPGDQAPLHNIVFTKIPAQLIEALRQRGIQAAQPYRTISRHPVYAHLAGGGFPNADQWNDHAVYLPFGMGLDPADAERIVAAVHQSGVPLQSCG